MRLIIIYDKAPSRTTIGSSLTWNDVLSLTKRSFARNPPKYQTNHRLFTYTRLTVFSLLRSPSSFFSISRYVCETQRERDQRNRNFAWNRFLVDWQRRSSRSEDGVLGTRCLRLPRETAESLKLWRRAFPRRAPRRTRGSVPRPR